jgi:hypothetical protein
MTCFEVPDFSPYPKRTGSAWIRIGVLACAAVGLGTGCARGPEPLSDQERARAESVGQDAANALAGALVTRLTGAMEEGGPVRAVEYCSTEALALTDQVAGRLPTGVTLKRTSSRYRNPQNAPDALEEEALAYFQAAHDRGQSLPEGFTQRASDGELRYYKPLVVVGLCIQCHGAADQIPPEVAEILAERYPDDRATGYSLGDFRGLIRVSLPAEDPSG